MTHELELTEVAVTRGDARRVEDRIMIACGLALGSGLIHVIAAVQHLAGYAPYTVFFEVLALAQFWWAIAIYRSARPRLMINGAVVSLGVVLIWLASRTVGLPIGPQPWRPEPVGVLDVVASADELVLALVVMFQLMPSSDRPVVVVCRRIVTGAGIWLILLSSLAFIAIDQTHAH